MKDSGPDILLVDDEEAFCLAVAQYMQSWASIRYALTYSDGQRLLQQRHPDILLADHYLPDGEGTELLHLALKLCPEAARVLITAHTDPDILQYALNELRITYYIAKPVELPQLQLLLQQLWYSLILRRSQQELQAQLRAYYQQLEEHIAERTRTLQHAYDELCHITAQRDQLFRFLLHDLRAPLSNLRMLCKELQQLVPADTQAGELLALSGDVVRTMEQLLDTMAAPASADATTALPPTTSIDLAELLKRCTAHFTLRVQAKSIQLSLQLPPSELPPICGNPALLERLVMNLLDNTLKYTPPGGRATVRLHPGHTHLELQVHNTGVGLSPDEIHMLLSGSGRPSAQPTAGEPSTGLGWQIIRHIAQLHHASLDITSLGKGTGTTVTVRFPLTTPSLVPLSTELP